MGQDEGVVFLSWVLLLVLINENDCLVGNLSISILHPSSSILHEGNFLLEEDYSKLHLTILFTFPCGTGTYS